MHGDARRRGSRRQGRTAAALDSSSWQRHSARDAATARRRRRVAGSRPCVGGSTTHRTGPVRPCQQLPSYPRPRGHQMTRGLINIQTVDARRSLVGTDTLERLPQVICRQRCSQQRCSYAPVGTSRAARFVTESFRQGFTLPHGPPPRHRGHLTQYLLHRHVGNRSFSFCPSSAELSLPGATSNYYGVC